MYATFEATDDAQAVYFQGVVYHSLEAIADLIGGQAAFTRPELHIGLQPLQLCTVDRQWTFQDGGSQVRVCPGGTTQALEPPLLIIRARHYLAAAQGSAIFGYRVMNEEGSEVCYLGKTVEFVVRSADSSYLAHTVESLDMEHRFVVAERRLSVRRALHCITSAEELAAGTNLVVRRRCRVDGVSYFVVTETSPSLVSFLVEEDHLLASTRESTEERGAYGRYANWYQSALDEESALRHGPRARIGETVCITTDFCWSLRRFEVPLLDLIERRMVSADAPVPVTFFMSGRWLQQHPEEMDALIRFSEEPSIRVTWGLHSWMHPKTGLFMNMFPGAELREDTLRLERLLLCWGIVPTVFYRFPGLIHDRKRLQTLLDMGLLSIDCDSWLAKIVNEDTDEFSQPINHGTIILVHGNGNEPSGIQYLRDWLHDHPGWRWGELTEFLDTDQPPRARLS